MKKIYLTAVLLSAVIGNTASAAPLSLNHVDGFEAVSFASPSFSKSSSPSLVSRVKTADIRDAASSALESYNTIRGFVKASGTRQTFSLKSGLSVEELGGIIDFDGNNVTIAFHGTANNNNIVTDILSSQALNLTGAGYVHSGFKSSADSVLLTIENIVLAHAAKNSLDVNTLTYRTTGHSLGGALATLFGYYLVQSERLGFDGENTDNRVSTISFASPRVGDAAFAEDYARVVGNENHLRFGAWGDIVPAVPFGALQGFKHTGHYVPVSAIAQLGVALKAQVRGFMSNPLDLTSPVTLSLVGSVLGAPLVTVPTALGSIVMNMHSMSNYAQTVEGAFDDYKANGGVVHQGILNNDSPDGFRARGGLLSVVANSVKEKVISVVSSSPVAVKVIKGFQTIGSVVSKAASKVSGAVSSLWQWAKGKIA